MTNIIPIHRPSLPPTRPWDAHKGVFGTVVVVGGCPTMLGAPALAAKGALRAGAGLVKIASDPGLLPWMMLIEPSATGIMLPGGAGDFWAIDAADPERRAVLAVGPGMGRGERQAGLVAGLLRSGRAMALDADGLNALADLGVGAVDWRLGTRAGEAAPPLVLTPHPGEYARLAARLGIEHAAIDPEERPIAAVELARATHAVVVLKGFRTIVTDGRHLYVNQTGNPALATAGTGDVLTGCVAGLMAQGMSALDAAVLGVHLHGKAADLWANEVGRSGLTASDLAALLPRAFRDWRIAQGLGAAEGAKAPSHL